MDRKAIQRILDYIEDNLKAEISVEELSDLAGFSLFHFLSFVSKCCRYAGHAVHY